MKTDNKGFTIVEILIVIVVLGILAGLVINVYGDIQQRARNAATITNTKNYQKAILAYLLENGEYPLQSWGNMAACLGLGYDDLNSDGTGDCRAAYGGYISEVPAFSTPIQKYIDSTQPTNLVSVNLDGNIFGGSFYSVAGPLTVNGESAPHHIVYYLEGPDRSCQLGQLIDGDWPNLNHVDFENTESYANHTLCVLGLPNPDTL